VLPFRCLEADDDDLYNYMILTRDVPKRIRETRLRRYIDDRDDEREYWCIGQHSEPGKRHLTMALLLHYLVKDIN
jgi:hypothetical protein